MAIEFLYFDLGKVLLDFDHPRMCRQVAEICGVAEQTVDQLLIPGGGIESDPLWQFECGQIEEPAFFDWLCQQLDARPDRTALHYAASDIFTPMEDSLALIEALHAGGHRLGILSNTNPVHWDFFMDGRYPILNQAFEVPLGSFHLQSMKPDATIYQRAAERAGVAPEAIFFTDDKPENIDGAQAAGWDAALFTGADSLRKELAERGIAVG